MPLVQFDGEVKVVDKDSEIAPAVAYLRKQKVLGVDTEARPSFKRGVHYPTALLQIATADRCYLFRLTHIPPIRHSGLGIAKDVRYLFRQENIQIPATYQLGKRPTHARTGTLRIH